MIRAIIITTVFFQVACAQSGEKDANQDEPLLTTASNKKDLSHLGCKAAWSKIVNEWKNNGGGFSHSLRETRFRIREDDKSLLAKIIKYSWQKQNEQGFYENVDSFGYWDISDENYRIVTFPHFDILEKVGPKECQMFSWLTAVIWDELVDNGEANEVFTFSELKEDSSWESPYAQQWVTYWLLVNTN